MLHLFYRKGPISCYTFKQSADLSYESIGFYITKMTLLKAEKRNGAQLHEQNLLSFVASVSVMLC